MPSFQFGESGAMSSIESPTIVIVGSSAPGFDDFHGESGGDAMSSSAAASRDRRVMSPPPPFSTTSNATARPPPFPPRSRNMPSSWRSRLSPSCCATFASLFSFSSSSTISSSSPTYSRSSSASCAASAAASAASCAARSASAAAAIAATSAFRESATFDGVSRGVSDACVDSSPSSVVVFLGRCSESSSCMSSSSASRSAFASSRSLTLLSCSFACFTRRARWAWSSATVLGALFASRSEYADIVPGSGGASPSPLPVASAF
mmetsp:Transcript_18860/g.39409  ORF Transcript_18860/g.39409 Transcript_18860/m.39409 type:complete len:263 (-) Transcript_18860:39-827(-)